MLSENPFLTIEVCDTKPTDIYHPHHPLHHLILDEAEAWEEAHATLCNAGEDY